MTHTRIGPSLFRALVAMALAASFVAAPVATPSADAGVGDGTPATLDAYWNGDATWVFAGKDTRATTGEDGYYNGSRVVVGGDGSWYLVNRRFVINDPCPGYPTITTQIRRSADQGATWSTPVPMVALAASSPWSCAATDGDLWYDEVANQWHYLFQCFDGTSWEGCALSRNGADPMGAFTIQPAGGNPVVHPKEIWNQICDDPSDDCSALAGGPGNVFDEGTFDIFDYDGTYYWVAFHGYDGKHGYRGIAKTANLQTWVAGNAAAGTPEDAVHDAFDSQGWRENWSGSESIGFGHGSILKEGGFYYQLAEAADVNLACSLNQNWDVGLLRSASLTNVNWSQLPAGNPIVYSSKGESGSYTRCNVQYANLFRDPNDGFIYLTYGRRSANAEYDGLYWYRLENTENLLTNSDLWRAHTGGWQRLGEGTNYVAYRLPNNSPDGTPYLAANCGGECGVNANSVYQDVAVPSGASGVIRFGGTFMSEGRTGDLNLVVH